MDRKIVNQGEGGFGSSDDTSVADEGFYASIIPKIIDIREPEHEITLRDRVVHGIRDEYLKTLPTMLLYDATGLRLFERITQLPEYYVTAHETDALRRHSKDIVDSLPYGIRVIELGSGNLTKIRVLLDEFERQKKFCHYYALDLDESELARSFTTFDVTEYSYIQFTCLHGTYHDAMRWTTDPRNRDGPVCILFMGSTLGNFDWREATSLLRQWSAQLSPRDRLIIGLDSCTDHDKVLRAYNDIKGVTKEFYYNALVHANRLLGCDVFRREDWDIETGYNVRTTTHEAYFVAKNDNIRYGDIAIKLGEKICIERSKKYPKYSFLRLWADSGFVSKAQYGNASEDYFIHVLELPTFKFNKLPEDYMTYSLPTVHEFENLWRVWDVATLSIVAPKALSTKPIGLRHQLIFYIGHVPTFSDIQLSRATRQPGIEPLHYWKIFERGIDPEVQNPSKCHSHSEVPSKWPKLHDLLLYRNKVRMRIRRMLDSVGNSRDPYIGRALWIGFEHEAMHLETFLYMLVQSDHVMPTRTLPTPDFEKMAGAAARKWAPSAWVEIAPQNVALGMDAVPIDKVPSVTYGWDNEMPRRIRRTGKFYAQARPITIREYAYQLQRNPVIGVPASWVHVESGGRPRFERICTVCKIGNTAEDRGKQPGADFVSQWRIRTIYGKLPLMFALDWPVTASYNQLEAYAKIEGCRIPTQAEAKAIYSCAIGAGTVRKRHPGKGLVRPTPVPLPPLVDLSAANVGFDHWHPLAVTEDDRLYGHADFGGVWEWTSTVMTGFEGFKPMPEYPNYTGTPTRDDKARKPAGKGKADAVTADFLGGKHNVVLGGSWATHPRIAGRTTFVNWWRRDYPYAWAGARLVRDKWP